MLIDFASDQVVRICLKEKRMSRNLEFLQVQQRHSGQLESGLVARAGQAENILANSGLEVSDEIERVDLSAVVETNEDGDLVREARSQSHVLLWIGRWLKFILRIQIDRGFTYRA